jgi:hypothetical protein
MNAGGRIPIGGGAVVSRGGKSQYFREIHSDIIISPSKRSSTLPRKLRSRRNSYFLYPAVEASLWCTANLPCLSYFDAFKAFERLNDFIDLI